MFIQCTRTYPCLHGLMCSHLTHQRVLWLRLLDRLSISYVMLCVLCHTRLRIAIDMSHVVCRTRLSISDAMQVVRVGKGHSYFLGCVSMQCWFCLCVVSLTKTLMIVLLLVRFLARSQHPNAYMTSL